MMKKWRANIFITIKVFQKFKIIDSKRLVRGKQNFAIWQILEEVVEGVT